MPSRRAVRYGIVASRYNQEITQRLLEGVLDFLQDKKIPRRLVDVRWVAGSFELPLAALQMAKTRRYRFVTALGCIVEGQTPHFRYLSQAVLQGLIWASLMTGLPITCGVITVRSWKQALERSRENGTNRGREAASAAWQLAKLI